MEFAWFSSWLNCNLNKLLAIKLKLFIALAPVARVSHIKGAVSFIAKFYKEINVCANAHISIMINVLNSFCLKFLV